MLTLAINWAQTGTVLLALLFLVACLLLILVVLIQKPQGGGLAGAFGSGAGSGQTAFGTRTGDALTVATIAFFVFYLATAVGVSYVARPSDASKTPQMQKGPAKGGEGTPAPASDTVPAGQTPAGSTAPGSGTVPAQGSGQTTVPGPVVLPPETKPDAPKPAESKPDSPTPEAPK